MLEGNSHIRVVRNHANAEAIGAAFEALQMPLILVFVIGHSRVLHIARRAVHDHTDPVDRAGDNLDPDILWRDLAENNRGRHPYPFPNPDLAAVVSLHSRDFYLRSGGSKASAPFGDGVQSSATLGG